MTTVLGASVACANEPVRQEAPAAYLIGLNAGGAQDFNEDDWRVAIATADRRLFWKIDTDPAMADRVMEVAASVDPTPAFALLMTANLPDPTVEAFDQNMETFSAGFESDPNLRGSEFVVETSGCRVMRSPPGEGEKSPLYTIITMDVPDVRQGCYRSTIALVLDSPSEFPAPDVDRIAIDGTAMVTQEAMPPMALIEAEFIEPETWQAERQAVSREGATFAPGEMIMLHAFLDYVGRDLPGAPGAGYEIQLDIEIQDGNGQTLIDDADVMRFTGTAIHRVPVRDDYFQTGVVTGFPLDQPGDYRIFYRMTDLNRLAERTEPLEIAMDVTVE